METEIADALLFHEISLVGESGTGSFKTDSNKLGWHKNVASKRSFEAPGTDIVSAQLQRTCGPTASAGVLKVVFKSGECRRFAGFSERSLNAIKAHLKQHFGVLATEVNAATEGFSWGDWQLQTEPRELQIHSGGENISFELDLADLSQVRCTGKSELSLEFKPMAIAEDEEALQEIRFFVPGGTSESGDLSAQLLKEEIEKCSSGGSGGLTAADKLRARFPDILVEAPRGRHDFEFYKDVLKVYGKTQSYMINYTSIKRIFMVHIPEKRPATTFLLLGLSPPLRYGKQDQAILVLNFETEKMRKVDFGDELLKQAEMLQFKGQEQSIWSVVARVLKHFTTQTIIAVASAFKDTCPGKVEAVRCTYKTTPVYLMFAMKSMMLAPKPAEWMRYDLLESVEFMLSSQRRNTFGLRVIRKDGKAVLELEQIEDSFYVPIFDWFSKENKLTIVRRTEAEKVRDAYALRAQQTSGQLVDALPIQGGGGRPIRRKAAAVAPLVVREAPTAAAGDDDDDEDDADFEGGDDSDDNDAEESAEEPAVKRPKRGR